MSAQPGRAGSSYEILPSAGEPALSVVEGWGTGGRRPVCRPLLEIVGAEASPPPTTHSFFSRLATLIMAAALRSTSSFVVAQLDTLIRIADCPCHCVPPHQQVPSL
jgi:hypothetical protein